DHLRDWRGEATLLPARLTYTLRPRHGPTVRWCGLEVSRAWRCGCRGNVASVLIEKPARGDFLAVLEGGYGLQYSPLLEYREGKGMVLFCQVDVSGRTDPDPAAVVLTRNILDYVSALKPFLRRKILYRGVPPVRRHLDRAGFSPEVYARAKLTTARVLIIGPGGGRELAADARAVAEWLKGGGHLLTLGLDGSEAGAFLPFKVVTRKQEHVAAYF